MHTFVEVVTLPACMSSHPRKAHASLCAMSQAARSRSKAGMVTIMRGHDTLHAHSLRTGGTQAREAAGQRVARLRQSRGRSWSGSRTCSRSPGSGCRTWPGSSRRTSRRSSCSSGRGSWRRSRPRTGRGCTPARASPARACASSAPPAGCTQSMLGEACHDSRCTSPSGG